MPRPEKSIGLIDWLKKMKKKRGESPTAKYTRGNTPKAQTGSGDPFHGVVLSGPPFHSPGPPESTRCRLKARGRRGARAQRRKKRSKERSGSKIEVGRAQRRKVGAEAQSRRGGRRAQNA